MENEVYLKLENGSYTVATKDAKDCIIRKFYRVQFDGRWQNMLFTKPVYGWNSYWEYFEDSRNTIIYNIEGKKECIAGYPGKFGASDFRPSPQDNFYWENFDEIQKEVILENKYCFMNGNKINAISSFLRKFNK